MNRIDKNYLFVCQLKEILHDFNLPRINVYTKDTVPRETRLYIKDGWVVRYLKGNFIRLHEYAYNWPEVNFTKNLIIDSSIYDEYTHEYFGDYLRFLRDYHNINLMGMYNCFFEQRPSRIYHIFKDGSKTLYSINTDDKKFNYYVVPIKFDQTYTIAIDSNTPYEIACILYNNKFISNTPIELVRQSLKKVQSSKFKHPFLYETNFECASEHWTKEKDLRLVLKLPKVIESSITILEGNFKDQADVVDFKLIPNFKYNTTETVAYITSEGGEIEEISREVNDMYSSIYCTKNSLLRCNNHNSYPLSDRLLEYIIGCAIYPLDIIDKNVERIQNSRYIRNFKNYGIWDDRLRYIIYKVLYNKIKSDSEGVTDIRYIDSYYDLTGYVDKDIEDLLGLNKYE